VQKRTSRFGLTTKTSYISGHHRNLTDDKQGGLKNCPTTNSFTLHHLPGEKNVWADTLSRLAGYDKGKLDNTGVTILKDQLFREIKTEEEKNYESKDYAKRWDAQQEDQIMQQVGIYTAHSKKKYYLEDTP
jgi:hypothetical protein